MQVTDIVFAHYRVSNYQACMSSEVRRYVQNCGVQVIGFRALRDLLRASA